MLIVMVMHLINFSIAGPIGQSFSRVVIFLCNLSLKLLDMRDRDHLQLQAPALRLMRGIETI